MSAAMHLLKPKAITPDQLDQHFDVVIIGSGIAGAIIAKELSSEGKHVLVVEASPDTDKTFDGYVGYLSHFYGQVIKDNQAPFPANPNAEMPRGSDLRKLRESETNDASYIVQSGPYVSDSVYTRIFGGTTVHWEAKTPRMLPEDFKTWTNFSQGRDWPIDYAELEPDYVHAEREIGVSADVEDQRYLDLWFGDEYVYPMKGLPLSYLDQMVDQGIAGTTVDLYGEQRELRVRPFPQGRNSIPNPAYDQGAGYRPVGAVASHQIEVGQRCQGNTNCVPICPVQARYHAGKTMAKAFERGRTELLSQAVASKVVVDCDSGRVAHVEVKIYDDVRSPRHTTRRVTGTIFVIAANAIETPRLMLASGLRSTSGLMGRNLMDHAYLLSWAMMPQRCGTMRGTSCTGGIVDLRGGAFRRHQAAFAIDIHNDGWGWATGGPVTEFLALVDEGNKFGRDLRNAAIDTVSSQLMFAHMIEMMPSESNRVTVDPGHKDPLGNMRPCVSMSMSDYTMRGAAYARQLSKTLFARLGATDHTKYDSADYGHLTYNGESYAIRGGNHLAGTHVMGNCKSSSVVNPDQRSWDHGNLYLAGSGSMPTIGTANVTLTLAALSFRTSRAILSDLKGAA